LPATVRDSEIKARSQSATISRHAGVFSWERESRAGLKFRPF
jgi:hypothetical protein